MRNGFSGSGRGRGKIKVFKKTRRLSPSFLLLFFCLFNVSLPACYFHLCALTKSLAQTNFKPDDYMRMMLFRSVTLAMQKKEDQVLPTGFDPITFWFLV